MNNFTTSTANKGITSKVIIILFALVSFIQGTSAKEVQSINSKNIDVIFYDTKDQGKIPYKYNLSNWPLEGKQAIMEAMEIVDNTLNLTNKMTVAVIWTADLVKNNTLGEAYSNYIDVSDVKGFKEIDNKFKYPQELINQLVGGNQYGGANVTIAFNSKTDWCFSSVEEPLYNQQDLITVTLHELAHGIGISSSFTKKNETMPYIYDKYIINGNGTSLVSNSATRASENVALNTGNLYFGGTNATVANNGDPIKLHAPHSLSSASLCHFDREYTHDEEGRLLIPGTTYGVSTRYFGNFTLAVLKDLGWSIKSATRSDDSYSVENEMLMANNIKVNTTSGSINIDNTNNDNVHVAIYTISGKLVKNEMVYGSGSIQVNANEIYVVKINNKTYKVRA